MRAPLISLVTLFAAMPAAAATRDFPVQGFDKVELHSAADVAISAGPRFAVHADGDPRLLAQLTADVRGNTLVFGWRGDGSVQVRNAHIRVTITMPRVAGASVGGAGTITINHVDAPQFAGSVSGAGTIRIADLRALHTALDMGGAGQIVVAGRTARLEAQVSGVGSVDAANLAAATATLGVSGTGKINARVNGPAEVSLSGLGSVVVAGNPRCAIRKSGLGSVRCG